jgi:hypothetical protein
VRCFHGYVESTSGQRDASGSSLVLKCVSYSRRTDLVPRYRAFQATTLLAISFIAREGSLPSREEMVELPEGRQ